MPVYEFNCEVCGAFGSVWRGKDNPPRFCSKICKNKGLTGENNGGGRHLKYTITPEMHADIERVYQEITGRGEIKALTQKLGIPRQAITKYAGKQGWIKKHRKGTDWTEQELKILEKNAHLSLETIRGKLKREGFERSVTGIAAKRRRERLPANLGGQSACSLAYCFGVDTKTITRWIKAGKLKARKRGTNRTASQGGDIWYIKDLHVKRFIVEYLPEVDFRKIDKFWLVNLLWKRK